MVGRLTRSFFHRDVTRTEAERLLHETQISGSFLLRSSRSKSDSYVLSVRRGNGEIAHLQIRRSENGFSFGEDNDIFLSVYDLIEHFYRRRNECRDKNNELIELTTPIAGPMPTLEKYYHGPITHTHVISLLDNCDEPGAFLVRDSETNPGEYVICMKTDEEITNIKIKYSNGYWFLVGKGQPDQIDRFKSLDELIYFYLRHNILIGVNRMSFRLGPPCLANWFYARDIHERCENLSQNFSTPFGPKTGFALEFQTLSQQSKSQSTTFHKRNGEKPENQVRNRFRNILPYDETRVILKNYPMTDYMNANRIRAPYESNRREYIVSQGPLPATVNDFWYMVQQEFVTCIVMITREFESGKNKCARYWPDFNMKKQYGSVSVENINEFNYGGTQSFRNNRLVDTKMMNLTDNDCSYRLRTLRITNDDGKQWDVLHCQYLAWGDHDSPLGSNPRDQNQLNVLFEFFRRFSIAQNEHFSSPIIVHCSAGIGRSGATIAIDILLHRIDTEGLNTDIDIPNLVKFLRSQRPGLVQTERQYELIYRLVEYYVEQLQNSSISNLKQ